MGRLQKRLSIFPAPRFLQRRLPGVDGAEPDGCAAQFLKGMGKTMRERLKKSFRIPEEIRDAFWKDTLRKNRLSLMVICIMILGMESFNMFRVLFWSNSGLGTLNNRIYFTLYLVLWVVAAVYLLLRRLLRNSSTHVRWIVQYGTALCALCWHAGINGYDLIRNPGAETNIYITAMLGLAVFIQMPVGYSLAAYVLSYVVFVGLAELPGGILSSGSLLNLTFTAIVSLAVSMTSFRHAIVTLSQNREIEEMNRQLREQVRKDSLTGLMNAAAFRKRVESHLENMADGSEISLVILDLDDFKSINDAFGHPCGDYILQETALKLKAVFPDAIGAARTGGDEFMLALTGVSAQEVESGFNQFLLELERFTWRGQALSVSCSMGACRTSVRGVAYDKLYGTADRALYRAKSLGKGRFVCYEYEPASAPGAVQPAP